MRLGPDWLFNQWLLPHLTRLGFLILFFFFLLLPFVVVVVVSFLTLSLFTSAHSNVRYYKIREGLVSSLYILVLANHPAKSSAKVWSAEIDDKTE